MMQLQQTGLIEPTITAAWMIVGFATFIFL